MENGIIIDMKRRSNIDLSSAKEYRKWIAELKVRYRATQIKAAVAVNSAMLEFYWNLGQDIAAMYPGKKRNVHFFENLSNALCLGIHNPIGLSPSNIRYALRFYELYRYLPQVVEDFVRCGKIRRTVGNSECSRQKVPGDLGWNR